MTPNIARRLATVLIQKIYQCPAGGIELVRQYVAEIEPLILIAESESTEAGR